MRNSDQTSPSNTFPQSDLGVAICSFEINFNLAVLMILEAAPLDQTFDFLAPQMFFEFTENEQKVQIVHYFHSNSYIVLKL